MVKTFSDNFVVQCLRCDALTPDEREEDDLYCDKCAASLVNRCTNDDNQAYGDHDHCGIVLDPEAVYCKKCATISLFASEGLIDNEYPEVEIVTPSSRASDDIPF